MNGRQIYTAYKSKANARRSSRLPSLVAEIEKRNSSKSTEPLLFLSNARNAYLGINMLSIECS